MERQFVTLIMAAGLGKRMDSDLPKVLHEIHGKPLLHYVIDTACDAGSARIILIIGYKKELVLESTKDLNVEWVVQEQQRGTGDAVNSARQTLTEHSGDTLVLSGDVPLLQVESVLNAWELHSSSRASATVFTFQPVDPTGYGRIIRGNNGDLVRVVEQRDADSEEQKVTEVNGGIYFFRTPDLLYALENISCDNKAGEYYLTDTIEILRIAGKQLRAFLVINPLELAGVNSKKQLKELEKQFFQTGSL